MPRRSPTIALLAGLAVTLSALALYSGYTIVQIRNLRNLQQNTIDRNRTDSLLLLRIQNDLNSIALALRDMLETNEPYPLTAWRAQFQRIRVDLADAMQRQEKSSFATEDQRKYLATSAAQFWDALDRIFAMAQQGQEEEARTRVRLSLEARHAALSTAVARALVQNNEREEQAAQQTKAIHNRVERNLYVFLAAMLILVAATSLYLVRQNQQMFESAALLSRRRSELAQQLITVQENTFQYISRELHDEFGQILTAIGAMLQRAARRAGGIDAALRADVEEVRDIVQSTLDRVRRLSQSLHPVVLDDAGLEGALDVYLPGFERQHGIQVRYQKSGTSREVDPRVAVHVYRVLQEALNNVARHSKSKSAAVRLTFEPASVMLEVEDEGVGFGDTKGSRGMGLVSMRERAELVNGRIEFISRPAGGALVRFRAPLAIEEAHASSG